MSYTEPYGTVLLTYENLNARTLLENLEILPTTGSITEAIPLTPRQGEVLDAALTLLVQEGDRLTMAGVAQQANCSKETLYKWFGGRDGLLTAIVRWQASKVKMPVMEADGLDEKELRRIITDFGQNLLGVLSGPISVALNRVAISQGNSAKSNLGSIVLENGRFAMGRLLKPVLQVGSDAGLLKIDDIEAAFRTFFGLLIRDTQLRLLLGEEIFLSKNEITGQADTACAQFFILYGN